MTLRVRMKYSKSAALRYTGHLDLHKVWERIFRRAQLPLAYSQGFHPQPKIQQACPLPLGFTSDCEVIDFWLAVELSIDTIRTALESALHPGIIIQEITQIPLSDPPLQTTIRSASYAVRFLNPDVPDRLSSNVVALLSSKSILRERRGKTYDLRPLIHSISLGLEVPFELLLQLTAMPGATGRPEEVLLELGIDPLEVEINRTALLFIGPDGK